MSRTKRTLRQKLLAVCKKVEAVAKRGHNAKYPYAQAADVLAAFRTKLFEEGILLIQNEEKPEWTVCDGVAGKFFRCDLAIDFEFDDGTEVIKRRAHGSGIDTEEKALYKAKTGALKYLLIGLALLPQEDADPEFDGSRRDESTGEVAARPPRAAQKPLAPFQVEAFNEAWRETGRSEDGKPAFLKAAFDVERVEDLKRKDLARAIRMLSGADTRPKATAGVQGKFFPSPALVEIQSKLASGTSDPKAFSI